MVRVANINSQYKAKYVVFVACVKQQEAKRNHLPFTPMPQLKILMYPLMYDN